MKAQSVLDTIGLTPHIRLERLFPESDVWIKSERSNPGGSIKDRIALAMIEAAEVSGVLKPGGTIIEATSGNTGVGLALVAAVICVNTSRPASWCVFWRIGARLLPAIISTIPTGATSHLRFVCCSKNCAPGRGHSACRLATRSAFAKPHSSLIAFGSSRHGQRWFRPGVAGSGRTCRSACRLGTTAYPILTMAEMPELKVVITENRSVGTYGQGSESANALASPAIAAAVMDATGKPIRRIPLRPEYVRAAMMHPA